MTLEKDQITELEKEAEHNNGKCSKCHQTIKIYRYKINKTHANFLKAMGNAVRDSGVNDVDISTIGIAYSVRSQVTKMRQHGLIARIKNEAGAQVPRHWLITHKGWNFLNGKPIPSYVIVYNNQVLGHDGVVNIHQALGMAYDPNAPIYEETPVSEPEARVLNDVRQPQRYMVVNAKFKGRDYLGKFKVSQVYELQIKKLEIGKPVEITGIDGTPHDRVYADIAGFQKDWKIE